MRQQHLRMQVMLVGVPLVAIMASIAVAQDKPAAQGQPAPPAQQQQQAPSLAPPKAYQAVAVKPAEAFKDAAFDAFRSKLADIAKRKDRAGLQKLVVSQGFFWESDTGDKINPKKSSFDNLATAIGLDDKEGSGWQVLSAAAGEVSLEPVEDRKGVMCGPASPQLDEAAFEALIKDTATDAEEWGFPQADGLEMHGTAQASSPVVEKLAMTLVRVLPDEPVGNQPPEMLRVVAPSGKIGYVPIAALAPVVFDQMCYTKDTGGWKITGYAGGD